MFNRTLMKCRRRYAGLGEEVRAHCLPGEIRWPGRRAPCQASDRARSKDGRMKMHDGEADIDAGLVGRLVAAQFPRLAGLPVSAVRPTGTVNAIYRLGDHLCARLPRVQRYAGGLEDEWRWLPRLAADSRAGRPGVPGERVPVPVGDLPVARRPAVRR
jgi:hypothetical protein